MIKALIFDFDGTILDSETPDYQSWKETYADYGVELPFDLWCQNIGSDGLFNPYTYLEAQLNRAVDRNVLKVKRKKRDNELMAQQVVMAGVMDYLSSSCHSQPNDQTSGLHPRCAQQNACLDGRSAVGEIIKKRL